MAVRESESGPALPLRGYGTLRSSLHFSELHLQNRSKDLWSPCIRQHLRQEAATTLGISSRKGFHTENENFTKSLAEPKRTKPRPWGQETPCHHPLLSQFPLLSPSWLPHTLEAGDVTMDHRAKPTALLAPAWPCSSAEI